GELYFAIQVPSGQSQLTVAISGGTGNADLYVRFGSVPTQSDWGCRPLASGNSEQCSLPNPLPGYWYVVLYGSAAFSGVSLAAGYSVPPTPVVTGRSPTPYVGAASFIARTSSFSATFSTTMAAATASTFVVNSSQRGRWFLGSAYGGTGTTTLATPAASFNPGEEVEVVLTTGLTAATGGAHLAAPLVTRYRVATAAATATFAAASGSPVAVGTNPWSAALGDVNGDGKVDLVTANYGSNNVAVLLGNGDGTFTAAAGSPVVVGTSPYSVAGGDVNGEGKIDLVRGTSAATNGRWRWGTADGT